MELDFELEGGGVDWRSRFKDRTVEVKVPRLFAATVFGTLGLSVIFAVFGWLGSLSGLDTTNILDLAKVLFFIYHRL